MSHVRVHKTAHRKQAKPNRRDKAIIEAMTGVAIWEGVHKHTFKWLDDQKKRWLLAEMSDFLDQLRSSD
jgi:hypothetical protein